MRQRINVDPIRCDGYGYCAELFPERIRLDDWGYPIVNHNPFGPDLAPRAQRAVRDCPRLALTLERVEKREPNAARTSRATR